METNGRIAVVEEMVSCLAAITDDACSAAHDTKVQACVDTVFPQACMTTGIITQDDGGTIDACQEVADSCGPDDAGTGGITKADCLASLSPFTPDGQYSILQCYNIPVGTCEDDFAACVLGL
jgi:hypothetical protein